MKRLILALLVSPCVLPWAAAQEAETVNFNALPNVGLKYKVTATQSQRSQRTISIGDQDPREMTSDTKSKYVFTQSILEIKNGKISKLARKYEDYENKGTLEMSGQDPRELDNEAPLAWKHVRISWEDDEVTVEVEEDEEWSEPEGRLRRMIRPKRWRQSAIPLPKEPKKVGDTWELTGEEAEKAFPRTPRRNRQGELMELPDRELKVAYEFASIGEHQKMRCAVIKMKLTSEIEDQGKTESTYEIHYSLEHRIVVGIKTQTKGSTSVEREIGDRSFTMESERSGKTTMTVKIVEPGKPAES